MLTHKRKIVFTQSRPLVEGTTICPLFCVCFFTLYLPRKMGGGNCFPSGCTGRIKATSTQAHNLLNASSLQHERKKQSKFHVLKTITPFFLLASDKGGVSILSQRTPHSAIVLLIQAIFSFTWSDIYLVLSIWQDLNNIYNKMTSCHDIHLC